MTIDAIAESQKGDGDATLKLIEKFNPLLKKYAYKLHYEDSYDDLLVDFVELLHDIQLDHINNKSEGGMVSYICTAIHSSYVKRLIEAKQLRNLLLYSDLTESQLYYVNAKSATSDETHRLDLRAIRRTLTGSEWSVIKLLYLSEYPVTKVASSYGISRQAVNQTKKRALQKLGKWLGQA